MDRVDGKSVRYQGRMKVRLARLVSLALILGSLHAVAAESWSSTPFGAANGFNLFVLNDLDHAYTDVQGRVAVGGVAKMNHYRLAWKVKLPPVLTTVALENCSLVVGREFHRGYGTFHGVVTYEGYYNFPPSEYGHVTGGVYRKKLIDFAAAAAQLRSLSKNLGKRAQTGTAQVVKYSPPSRDGLILKGSDPVLNVFQVRGADLTAASYLRIEAPEKSTVLVNIDGKSSEMRAFGFDVLGVKRERVLYNFFEAETLAFSNIGIQGSVLAPWARVDFQNGNIDGMLLVDSLVGNGQVHLHLFEGALPVCSCE